VWEGEVRDWSRRPVSSDTREGQRSTFRETNRRRSVRQAEQRDQRGERPENAWVVVWPWLHHWTGLRGGYAGGACRHATHSQREGTVPRGEKKGGGETKMRRREGWRLQQLGWRDSRCRVSVCGCIKAAGQGRYEQLKRRQGETCEPTANCDPERVQI
jgi:hypothetical protein